MATRAHVLQTGRRLEYLTIGYNCVEGLISVWAGLAAGSISLVGFGVDSAIEVASGAALLWRLGRGREVEGLTLRVVGACFLGLAAYVGWEAAEALVRREAPERSVVGIVLAAVSVVTMPLLARAKRRVAGELGSEAMRADSRQTDFCAYLSGILLGGLLLNALLGWWWADPLAALVMVPIIGWEGIAALRGRACCECGGGRTGCG
jgi:divalent metal cation (Fe/Co/Zn/Cd) transporter